MYACLRAFVRNRQGRHTCMYPPYIYTCTYIYDNISDAKCTRFDCVQVPDWWKESVLLSYVQAGHFGELSEKEVLRSQPFVYSYALICKFTAVRFTNAK